MIEQCYILRSAGARDGGRGEEGTRFISDADEHASQELPASTGSIAA